MNRTLTVSLIALLAAIVALACLFPAAFVAPGRLIAGHAQFENNCFACHDAFHGASIEKCQTCHSLGSNRRMTTARPGSDAASVSSHLHPAATSCTKCHIDHEGLQPYRSFLLER